MSYYVQPCNACFKKRPCMSGLCDECYEKGLKIAGKTKRKRRCLKRSKKRLAKGQRRGPELTARSGTIAPCGGGGGI